MSEWQPIETAPKDGEWFLAYGDRIDDDGAPKIGAARWMPRTREYWQQTDQKTQKLVVEDESGWDYDLADIAYPTHWMPLPEAPK